MRSSLASFCCASPSPHPLALVLVFQPLLHDAEVVQDLFLLWGGGGSHVQGLAAGLAPGTLWEWASSTDASLHFHQVCPEGEPLTQLR